MGQQNNNHVLNSNLKLKTDFLINVRGIPTFRKIALFFLLCQQVIVIKTIRMICNTATIAAAATVTPYVAPSDTPAFGGTASSMTGSLQLAAL